MCSANTLGTRTVPRLERHTRGVSLRTSATPGTEDADNVGSSASMSRLSSACSCLSSPFSTTPISHISCIWRWTLASTSIFRARARAKLPLLFETRFSVVRVQTTGAEGTGTATEVIGRLGPAASSGCLSAPNAAIAAARCCCRCCIWLSSWFIACVCGGTWPVGGGAGSVLCVIGKGAIGTPVQLLLSKAVSP